MMTKKKIKYNYDKKDKRKEALKVLYEKNITPVIYPRQTSLSQYDRFWIYMRDYYRIDGNLKFKYDYHYEKLCPYMLSLSNEENIELFEEINNYWNNK